MKASTRVKGARDLLFDGVEVLTNLVQKTHTEVSDRWTERAARAGPVAPIARGVNRGQKASAAVTFDMIRLASRGVKALAQAFTDPMLADDVDDHADPGAAMRQDVQGSVPWWADQAQAILNGFFGDHLARRGNGLDLGMALRHDGDALALTPEAIARAYPQATPKVCVFVHGVAITEWCWVAYADRSWGDPATCYGTLLAAELGYTPLYVRYNAGRHISENGLALSTLLEAVQASYPVPIEELTLVGHSMGGLVARSAAHQGAAAGRAWAQPLRHVVCLGAPHLGAPLEKGAELLARVLRNVPAAGATVPAAILDARSDGIRDLRHGYITEDEWRSEDLHAWLHDNRQSVPPVDGVGYYAVAATITEDPDHPAGRLLGDLMVRTRSGVGADASPARRIPFDLGAVCPGMNHLQLANHPAVYAVLRRCLAGERI